MLCFRKMRLITDVNIPVEDVPFREDVPLEFGEADYERTTPEFEKHCSPKCGSCSLNSKLGSESEFKLINTRIGNAVRCVPPKNKPIGEEINQCSIFLEEDIATSNHES